MPNPTDLQKLKVLRRAIYGRHAVAEMFWADTLYQCSKDACEADIARGTLSRVENEAWLRAMKPQLDAVVADMCTAAFKGNPAPFERLAQCVEWTKKTGRHTGENKWHDQLSRDILGFIEKGNRASVDGFIKAQNSPHDRKTVAARFRDLGIPVTTGRPRSPRNPGK